MAAQIAAGIDGMDARLDPGAPSDAPYDEPAPLLPRGLGEAMEALAGDACYSAAFGALFVDYFTRLKQAELDRFEAEVSDWEHAEYFDLL